MSSNVALVTVRKRQVEFREDVCDDQEDLEDKIIEMMLEVILRLI